MTWQEEKQRRSDEYERRQHDHYCKEINCIHRSDIDKCQEIGDPECPFSEATQ